MSYMRKCVGCGLTKPASQFYSGSNRCKACTFKRPQPDQQRGHTWFWKGYELDKDGWPTRLEVFKANQRVDSYKLKYEVIRNRPKG